jgi:hypothetical protein
LHLTTQGWVHKALRCIVDRILKGANDLPVGQANEIRSGHQLEHRKTLGVTIPPSLLARAD